MKADTFEVSDKVVLHPYSVPPTAAKPRLKRGRVYCINQVADQHGVRFVGLVGVEFRKLRPDRRTRDPQGMVTLYCSDTFQRAGRRKESA